MAGDSGAVIAGNVVDDEFEGSVMAAVETKVDWVGAVDVTSGVVSG